MKKKILIPIIAAVVLIAIFFIPVPNGIYNDGGTREYISLTYKIVVWNRITNEGTYKATKVYFGDDRNKSIDELWELEHNSGMTNAKPVIYLYPEEEMEISVRLTLDGKLTCTYPDYGDGWTVTAKPDGTLVDADGKVYNYLYWEGTSNAEYDFSKGFCVKGEDTAAFLEDALAKLGLNRREANEFIVYWLPLMQDNPYNIISFQSDVYTDAAKLEIAPNPDTLIRVFMAWKSSDKYTELEAQELTAPEREGFTVVEWGGAEID